MTADEQAQALATALLAPVEQVGRLLAIEADKVRAEVNELRAHVDGLQRRVAELEARADS